jgi:hypothetical protein
MQKLGLFLLALGLLVVGAQMPLQSQPSGPPPATTNYVALTNAPGTRLVITGVAGQRTYVTAVLFAITATATLRVIEGTGGTCASGTANIINTTTFVSATEVSMGTGNGALWALQPGNNLCTIVGVADVGGFMSYTQY